MKQKTKQFFEKEVKNTGITEKNIKYNAKKAFEKHGIPKDLWLELSEEFLRSKLFRRIKDTKSTIFMAGFVVGWIEKSKKSAKMNNKGRQIN